MATPTWAGTWAGGRVLKAKDGRTSWVIRRSVKGTSFTITLDARTEREALAELALFERDPFAYRTRRQLQADAHAQAQSHASRAVFLEEATIQRFLVHQRKADRSPKYVRDNESYLRTWAKDLGDRDLRTVTLQDVRKALSKHEGAQRKRMASFKSFCSWLQSEGDVAPENNPGRHIHLPAPRPEKALREKGYTLKQVEALYRAIAPWKSTRAGWGDRPQDVQPIRDLLLLLAKTGMHTSEADRIARGLVQLTRVAGQGEIAATLRFTHKSGLVHLVSIDAQTLAAVERLQARGSLPADTYVRRVIREASERIGQPIILLGQLRHTFATQARQCGRIVRPEAGGVSVEEVAAALGHTNTRTTRLFYLGTHVPPMVVLPLKLRNAGDPLLETQARASA